MDVWLDNAMECWSIGVLEWWRKNRGCPTYEFVSPMMKKKNKKKRFATDERTSMDKNGQKKEGV